MIHAVVIPPTSGECIVKIFDINVGEGVRATSIRAKRDQQGYLSLGKGIIEFRF